MTVYSHYEDSVPCPKDGYYVGAKGSEVQFSDGDGYLYQAGTKVTVSAATLNTLTGTSYANALSYLGQANYKVKSGQFSASAASVDITPGLTTIVNAIVVPLYRQSAIGGDGASASAFYQATAQLAYGSAGIPTDCVYRITGTKIRVLPIICGATAGSTRTPTLSGGFEYIAIGT